MPRSVCMYSVENADTYILGLSRAGTRSAAGRRGEQQKKAIPSIACHPTVFCIPPALCWANKPRHMALAIGIQNLAFSASCCRSPTSHLTPRLPPRARQGMHVLSVDGREGRDKHAGPARCVRSTSCIMGLNVVLDLIVEWRPEQKPRVFGSRRPPQTEQCHLQTPNPGTLQPLFHLVLGQIKLKPKVSVRATRKEACVQELLVRA